MQIATSRQAQEVQAAMVVAKRYPRNESEAYSRIMQSCKRKGLAECAMYAYPKGGTTVTGPSIRLAEALAQNWGNLDFGIIELEKRDGESTVMAFCWDLETNTRQTKIFQVGHEIEKKGGQRKVLTDPRDIYELVANQGARRLRACILGVIPGDIVDAAVEQCEKTLQGDNKVPLIDRVRKMALVFQEEHQVSVAMLEKRLGHKLEATTEQELVTLRKIYTAIRDGASKREQHFELVDTVTSPDGLSTATTAATTVENGVTGQAAASAGQPASSIPNDTLGEKKARAPKKDSPGNDAFINQLRSNFERDGIGESEFVGALIKAGVVPPGTKLSNLTSEYLQQFITDYSDIIKTI